MAIHDLYRAAGKPSIRRISDAIRDDHHQRDAISHETISKILNGRIVGKWSKVECLVRGLVRQAVAPLDEDAEVRRCHGLWLAASDVGAPGAALPRTPPSETRRAGQPVAAPELAQPAASPSDQMSGGTFPPRNPEFVGRTAALEILDRTPVTTSPVAVVGRGGVGKTQLAIEHVYRHLDDYDLVWWVPAEHPASTRAYLVALGEHLRLPDRTGVDQKIRAVLDVLEDGRQRWLLVYDNATSVDIVRPYMPSRGGRIIVTSRKAEWGESAPAVVSLTGFERADSLSFVRAGAADITEAEAEALATRVDDLPLALRHVVAMHTATGTPISEYLRLFDRHLDELLTQGASIPDRASALISTRATFEALSASPGEAAAVATQLLALFGFLGPEPVSQALLRSGRDGNVSAPLGRALREQASIELALRELSRFGLAAVNWERRTVQVHRLVQSWVREAMDERLRREGRVNVHEILTAPRPGNPDAVHSWALRSLIAPQVIPADLVGRFAPASHAARETALDQARYLFAIGDYGSSRELAQLMRSTWSRPPSSGGLGEDHEHTLKACRHLSNALRMLGDYRDCRELNEQVLTRLLESPRYGEKHDLTIAVAFSVGFDLRLAGDFKTAHERDVENLRRARSYFGDRHRRTLTARNNVAASLRMLGDYAAALEIDRALVDDWQGVDPGFGQPVLWTLGSLAQDQYGLGHYAEALATIDDKMLPVARKTLGERHRHVLLARRTRASCLRKLRRLVEALTVVRGAYDDARDQLGPDHEHTLALAMSLALTLCSSGQRAGVDEAAHLAVEAASRYRIQFGPHHPLVLAAEVNHAAILRAQGRAGWARRMDEATHNGLCAVLGDRHPYAICAANNLAVALAADGRPEMALPFALNAFELSCEVSGAQHPNTQVIAGNLALARDVGEDRELQARAGHALAHAVSFSKRSQWTEVDIEPPPM
ncbi:MAG TPA: FxSxx-COOH system tetratricopeptide repeat protein [Micromonosporaceae bacterium]|nr:FxSxx-COOH system tetratricopeptide repeat protein [Micromonosporaceae bacterium]